MAVGKHTPRRRRVEIPAGGVFVLRVWTGPDGELMGRAQWSTARGDTHSAVLSRTSAILDELRTFCDEALVPDIGVSDIAVVLDIGVSDIGVSDVGTEPEPEVL